MREKTHEHKVEQKKSSSPAAESADKELEVNDGVSIAPPSLQLKENEEEQKEETSIESQNGELQFAADESDSTTQLVEFNSAIRPPTSLIIQKQENQSEFDEENKEKVTQAYMSVAAAEAPPEDGEKRGNANSPAFQMKKEPVQRKKESNSPETPSYKPNNTGLPDKLKGGMEQLSGYSLDDVNVHYNSSKPAQMKAHAYAQGADIHLGPGQEKHLPHEAWHVVQQKQGRVKPTLQMKGVNVNDDKGLEKEADVMGEKSLSVNNTSTETKLVQKKPVGNSVQGKWPSLYNWWYGIDSEGEQEANEEEQQNDQNNAPIVDRIALPEVQDSIVSGEEDDAIKSSDKTSSPDEKETFKEEEEGQDKAQGNAQDSAQDNAPVKVDLVGAEAGEQGKEEEEIKPPITPPSTKRRRRKRNKSKKAQGNADAADSVPNPRLANADQWATVGAKKKEKKKREASPSDSFRISGDTIYPQEAVNSYYKNKESYGDHVASNWLSKHLNSFNKGNDHDFYQVRISDNTNATGRIYFGDQGTIFWSSNLSHSKDKGKNTVTIFWFNPAAGWTKIQGSGMGGN